MVWVNIALAGQADDLSLEPQTCVTVSLVDTVPEIRSQTWCKGKD